jgi:hypothetical protein
MTVTDIINGVQLVTDPEALKSIVRVSLAANIRLAVWGSTAIGKTTIIGEEVELCGWENRVYRLGNYVREDLSGIPHPEQVQFCYDGTTVEEGGVRFLLPDILPLERRVGKAKIAVVLDEMDRTEPIIFGTVTEMLFNHSINGLKFGPNVRFITIGNGSTDIGTVPIPSAIASRLCHIYFAPHGEKAFASWAQWSVEHGSDPVFAGFYGANIGMFDECVGDKSKLIDYAKPVNRAKTEAGRLIAFLKAARARGKDYSHIQDAMVAGFIGPKHLDAWKKFSILYDQAPSREEIVDHAQTCKVPDDVTVMCVLFRDLAAWIKHRLLDAENDKALPSAVNAIVKYFLRWPPEQMRAAVTHFETESIYMTLSCPAYAEYQKKKNS